MSGFVEIAKIVIKYGFFFVIILLLGSIILSLVNLAEITTFLNGLLGAFQSVLAFTYNVLYYWTAGAFGYIYVAVMSIVITKLVFWSSYGIIQAYKIVVEWLVK